MRKATAVVVVLALASATTVVADDSSGPDRKAPETSQTEERSPVWFAAFATSTFAFVGGVTLWGYSTTSMHDEVELIRATNPTSNADITEQDCGNQAIEDVGGHLAKACTWRSRARVAMWTTAAAIPLAVITGYFAFRSLPKKEKRSVALIPTVTTDGASAMLDIRW
ncbi:MAG: hypothetical protein ACKV2T_35500 [Kofleriaceae bacterium]